LKITANREIPETDQQDNSTEEEEEDIKQATDQTNEASIALLISSNLTNRITAQRRRRTLNRLQIKQMRQVLYTVRKVWCLLRNRLRTTQIKRDV
jgi:hypothetical protein